MQFWHTGAMSAVFEGLHTNENGLDGADALRRLEENGANSLPEKKPDGVFTIFFRQFQSPLIYVLLAASATVFVMGETADGAIILAVIIFNAFVGTFQEGKAQNTLRALKKYVETNATVLRDGREVIIPSREVVPGDVLVLVEGEKVPCDARVFLSHGLKVDEASLTGESTPVNKMTDVLTDDDATTREQSNMVFSGTNIVAGNGRAVATETGIRTVIGKIATEISTIDSEMPLKTNIRNLSRAIVVVVALISGALFVLGLYEGQELTTIFATVVSLAVSVIPEGLPIVITLVLATGVWRMSKKNALVKKLQAVEALGQAQVIAVDKTGTITKNELVIREVWTEGKVFKIGGIGYEAKGTIEHEGSIVDAANHPELLLTGKMAALCGDARVSYSETESRWRVSGDPTEAAIRIFGEKTGFVRDDLLRESPPVSEVPFDFKNKYHASLHAIAGKNFLTVEGAPEVILSLSTHIRQGGKNVPLKKSELQKLEEIFKEMSDRGLRVVAGAMRENASATLGEETVTGLTFVSFFGMQDILRPEVADAMKRATDAGIRVVMITGDHQLTARAIAKEAGIWHEGDEVVTGSDIDRLTDSELSKKLSTASVFARVTPEHKLQIITAYKRTGRIVAMTGDGVNDAPSLVAADLGVAMGKIGTEVAKEAADIVLLDDNFGSIVSAVEEGRNIYRTIQRVILYLFSTSLGEVLVITVALLLGYPLPILAAQIIWLNLVTDGFLDVSLAMEPKEEGLLHGAFKKPTKYIVSFPMVLRMLTMALPMLVGTLYMFTAYVEIDIQKAWTISLTTLAVFQWFNAWNCRSDTKSIFTMNPFSNKFLIGATAIVVCLQLLALYTPILQSVLRTVPLTFTEWMTIIGVASSIIVVEEIRKIISAQGKRKNAQTVRAVGV